MSQLRSRPPLSLLRRLHRAFVYSVLDGLIAKEVQVSSAEGALDDVLRAVTQLVPISVTTMGPDLVYRAGAAAKYGILDLTYGIGATPLPIHRPGLGALRALSLVEDVSDLDALETAETFLHDLVLETEAGGLYVKVFLQSEKPNPTPESILSMRLDMPPGFWPRRFVVADACLTNAPSIWLAKHFYL
jgi:hypothetical protein